MDTDEDRIDTNCTNETEEEWGKRGTCGRVGALPWILPSCLYDSLGFVQNIRLTTPAQIHRRHVLCAFCRFPVRGPARVLRQASSFVLAGRDLALAAEVDPCLIHRFMRPTVIYRTSNAKLASARFPLETKAAMRFQVDEVSLLFLDCLNLEFVGKL